MYEKHYRLYLEVLPRWRIAAISEDSFEQEPYESIPLGLAPSEAAVALLRRAVAYAERHVDPPAHGMKPGPFEVAVCQSHVSHIRFLQAGDRVQAFAPCGKYGLYIPVIVASSLETASFVQDCINLAARLGGLEDWGIRAPDVEDSAEISYEDIDLDSP
jgi:hypothetical protein